MRIHYRRHTMKIRLLGAMLSFTVSCASSRGAPPVPTSTATRVAAAGRALDTVWYVSTRARVEKRDSHQFADSMEFGYVLHSHLGTSDPFAGTLDVVLEDSVRVSATEFIAGVRAATFGNGARDVASLYVHGFGTSLHECWEYASESRIRSRSGAPWVAFCWPSNGSGVARPVRGAIFSSAYVSDSAAAAASQPGFVRAVELTLEAVPAAQLMLVAHSLGAQLLGDALSAPTNLRAHLTSHPARAIVFAAPDVEVNRFADELVPALQPLTERLVVYISGRDRMLALSRARSGTVRAGASPRIPRLRPRLETVDATGGLVAENGFQQLFGTHHALRRASSVIFDLVHVVGARRHAECRTLLGTAAPRPDGVWQLSRARPDTNMIAQRCPKLHGAP